MRRFQHALFLLLMLFSSALWATPKQQAEVLFVAETLPPYFFVNDQGQQDGALYDIVTTLIDNTQINASVVFMPWARAYELSQTQANVIMVSLLKTPAREDQFQWIEEIYRAEAFLVKLATSNNVHPASLEQARQYVVGTIRGYGAEQYLRNQGFSESEQNLVLTVDYHQLWGMLFKKRVDLVFTNTIGLQVEVDKAGFDPSRLEKAYAVPNFPNELHLATGLKTPKKLVTRLRRALQAMKKQGSYQQILRRWKLTD